MCRCSEPRRCRRLLAPEREELTLLTAELDRPDGYGRIVRNKRGSVTRIVEDKDATPAQRRIREVNTGIMALPGARLAAWLKGLSNDNAQREYYLTDVVRLALADRVPVQTVKARDTREVLGVNSKEQLAQLERAHQLAARDASHAAGRHALRPPAHRYPGRACVRG